MNIALPTWSGRISPVLDVAENFLLVEAKGGGEVVRTKTRLENSILPMKVGQLAKLGVEVLICGALSREMETLLHASGIQVIPHTCGPAEEVLQAFLNGEFTGGKFLMPGCCGRRRQGHRWQENQCGAGSGRGHRAGRGNGAGRGRGGSHMPPPGLSRWSDDRDRETDDLFPPFVSPPQKAVKAKTKKRSRAQCTMRKKKKGIESCQEEMEQDQQEWDR